MCSCALIKDHKMRQMINDLDKINLIGYKYVTIPLNEP